MITSNIKNHISRYMKTPDVFIAPQEFCLYDTDLLKFVRIFTAVIIGFQ